MLPCPRCKIALALTRKPQGIHYVCPQCLGQSVNLPLLRRTIEPTFVNSLWQSVRNAPPIAHHQALPCPSCAGRMHPAGIGAEPVEVQVDICRHCQIIWLDKGELDLLPAAAKPPEPIFPFADMSPEIAEKLAPALIARERSLAKREFSAFGDHGYPPDGVLHTLITVFGFPVPENAPERTRIPIITWTLLAVCVLLHVLPWWTGAEPPIPEFGFVPADPWRHGGLTLITSFFLHAGILHLVGNMWFLFITGDALEELLGRVRFLLLLALGQVAAMLTHLLFGGRPDVPCVGASGAISALILYYALALPHVNLVFCLRLYFYPYWIRISAAWAVVFWVCLQLLGSLLLSKTSDIAYTAHLGGALGGLLYWWAEKAHETRRASG